MKRSLDQQKRELAEKRHQFEEDKKSFDAEHQKYVEQLESMKLSSSGPRWVSGLICSYQYSLQMREYAWYLLIEYNFIYIVCAILGINVGGRGTIINNLYLICICDCNVTWHVWLPKNSHTHMYSCETIRILCENIQIGIIKIHEKWSD